MSDKMSGEELCHLALRALDAPESLTESEWAVLNTELEGTVDIKKEKFNQIMDFAEALGVQYGRGVIRHMREMPTEPWFQEEGPTGPRNCEIVKKYSDLEKMIDEYDLL